MINELKSWWEGVNLSLRQAGSISEFLFDNRDLLIGKLMESVEILGLPSKQEEAFKKTIKEHVYNRWDWFNTGITKMVDQSGERCDMCKQCDLNARCSNCEQSIARMTFENGQPLKEDKERLVAWLRKLADEFESADMAEYDPYFTARLMK